VGLQTFGRRRRTNVTAASHGVREELRRHALDTRRRTSHFFLSNLSMPSIQWRTVLRRRTHSRKNCFTSPSSTSRCGCDPSPPQRVWTSKSQGKGKKPASGGHGEAAQRGVGAGEAHEQAPHPRVLVVGLRRRALVGRREGQD
jgi:hypothetical protein